MLLEDNRKLTYDVDVECNRAVRRDDSKTEDKAARTRSACKTTVPICTSKVRSRAFNVQ